MRIPKITEYGDYRRFLRDYYAARKRSDPSFSYGSFAKRAGVARNHLKGVLDGKGLSPSSIQGYSKGLGLDETEAEYFRLMVSANQTKGAVARRAYTGAMRRWLWQRQHRPVPSSEAMLGLVRSWARTVVYGLANVSGFRAEPRWISRRLRGRVSEVQASEALRFLRQYGFIRARGSRWFRAAKRGCMVEGTKELKQAADALLRRSCRKASAIPCSSEAGDAHMIPLTSAQVRVLAEKYRVWLQETVPKAPRGARPGDLYLLLWDPIPLSTVES